MKINSLSKYFLVAVASLIVLTACKKSPESSGEVLTNAKEAVIDLNSGTVDITGTIKGQEVEDAIDLEAGLVMTFDDRKEKEKKLDAKMKVTGTMKSQNKTVNGDLDAQMISIGSQYYVKINKLSSNDEGIVMMEPFINQYKEKWLRIAEDFIPANIRNLQAQNEMTEEQRKQIEELFLETKFFTVAKDYGMEELDGVEVYHYALTPDQEAFKTYMTKSALVEGRPMTQAEIDQSVAFLSSLEKAEFFISKKDYSLKKALFTFSGDTQSPGSNLTMEITVLTSGFNQSTDIEAPASSEDFNPLNLIMGLGSLPGDEALNPALLPENSAPEQVPAPVAN